MGIKGIFVGSFNPWHKGHEDILKKAQEVCDEVVIGVAQNENKDLFDLKARVDFIRSKNYQGVQVYSYAILEHFLEQMDFSSSKRTYLIRGLRDGKDVDYELLCVLPYKGSFPALYFISEEEYRGISSSKIREEKSK